ncbi:MAG: META domain-containing protein [Pseudomonadota bacterium]|nr:META domain-containing protein [Pseudomonadota bacterium]
MIFLLSGCAVSSTHDPASAAENAAYMPAPALSVLALTNSHWHFTEIDGSAVPVGVDATLMFNGNGHVSGRAGCNSYGGTYQQTPDGTLHFGAILSTKMACLQPPGVMQAEQAVFDAMRHTSRARMDAAELVLLDVDGAKLATLQTQH